MEHAAGGGRHRVWVPVAAALVVALMVFPAYNYGSRPVGPSASTSIAALKPGVYPTLPGQDSPTYLRQSSRTANDAGESILGPRDAANISLLWSYQTGGGVFTSPAVVNGVAYFGSWDGYEYAVTMESGQLLWKTFLGVDNYTCGGGIVGVTSSATVVNGVLYVGGGDSNWDALSASTGQVLWNLQAGWIGKGGYSWSSPLLVGNELYVGLASQCDVPLVPAALLEINATTGAVQQMFNTTIASALGASIWASPSDDPWDNTIFAVTGNPGTNKNSDPYSEALLKFNASTLQLLSEWQVPKDQVIGDGDFGATPTVVLPLAGRPVVVANNKNGFEYAWNATNPAAGPIWELRVSTAGESIAPAAWGGGKLFIAGANTTIGGITVSGSLRAVNPLTGAVAWQRSEWADVQTAPAYSNGLVIVVSSHHIDIINATNGRAYESIFRTHGCISAPVVSHGEIFVGCTDGTFNAYGIPLGITAASNATTGVAPLSVRLTGTATGGFPAYSYNWTSGTGALPVRTATAAVVYSAPGTYEATFTVVDSTGRTAVRTVGITVVAPLLVQASSQSAGSELSAYLNATTSGGFAPFNLTWSLGTMLLGWGPSIVYSFASPGNYLVNLTASDTLRELATAQVTVIVAAPPVSPAPPLRRWT